MTSFLLTFRGTYPAASVNAAEIWQFGIRLWGDGSVPDNTGTFPAIAIDPVEESGDLAAGTYVSNWNTPGQNLVGYLEQVLGAASNYWVKGTKSTSTLLQQIKYYPIDTAGKVVQTDLGAAVATITIDGTGYAGTAASLMPLEVATAVSLRTARSGPRGRGRIYLPAPPSGAGTGSDGRFSTTYCEDLAEETAAFLSELAVESPTPTEWHMRPVITGPSDWNRYQVINSVNVGNVPDVQRRRRNKLVEVRSAEEVVYG